MPFPVSETIEGAIGVGFEPRLATDGTSLTSSSTIADAITGIMTYMLNEGFSSTKVSLIRSDTSGKRVVVGTFLIGELSTLKPAGGETNTTRLESAFS